MTKPIIRITYGGLLLLCLLLLSFTPGATNAQPPTPFRLRAPAFLSVAQAQADVRVVPSEVAAINVLVDEAGIAAYFNRGGSINLEQVRGIYRVVEREQKDQYLIGSVQVKTNSYTYPETEDVHLYVNTNGWVMAYYLNADPVGKIFDAAQFDGGSINTKLEIVLGRAATALGVGSGFTPTFYDFRYPNATHLLIIGEKTNQSVDAFQVNLPSSFTFLERGWSHWTNPQGGTTHCTFNRCKLKLNDVDVNTGTKPDEGKYGTLTAAQLAAGQTHTISLHDEFTSATIFSTGALVLIYRETP